MIIQQNKCLCAGQVIIEFNIYETSIPFTEKIFGTKHQKIKAWFISTRIDSHQQLFAQTKEWVTLFGY
jgi:hypothetical protein